MNLLFLIPDLGSGGQERQLTYLAKALGKKGHNVKVITWNTTLNNFHSDSLSEKNVEVIPLGRNIPGIWSRLTGLRAFIKKEKVDIVQSYSFYLNFFAYIACLGTSAKAWGTIRSSLELYRSETPAVLFWLSSVFPFRFISNNHAYAETFRSKWLSNYLVEKVKVIPNAIDFDILNTDGELPANLPAFYTVSVGRVSPEKRIDGLLQVHRELKKTFPNIHHLHAGEGPLFNEMKEQRNEMGLESSFHFLGNIKGVDRIIASSAMLLHTADFEGCPNAVMEAMALGKAVVSTNCGDVKHLLVNGKGGYIVERGNWDELTGRVVEILKNEALRASMEAYNLGESLVKFSIERMATGYEQLYKAN